MSKLLAVFGATGQQGGSVIDTVLQDPKLSREYTIRAITRDVKSDKAVKLSKSVEVVAGDATEPASLNKALDGVHTVFIMTMPIFGDSAYQKEYDIGKAIADAAVNQGCKYIIFSTLPGVKQISGGKYTKVTNFDSKADIEKYIKGLSIKSAFVAFGEFMENFNTFDAYDLRRQPDDTYHFVRSNSPSSRTPMLYASKDAGKFVGNILADPAAYEGKTIAGSSTHYTLEEIAETLTKTTGKTVLYKQVSTSEFHKLLPGWIADIFVEVLAFAEEYGYFGADGEKQVAQAASNAQTLGSLTTLEEYLTAHPPSLEE